MKKSVFGAIMLVLAATLGSCRGTEPGGGNKDNPTAVTGIEMNPTEVNLVDGGSIRLSATLKPAGAKGDITWASSDTTVAVVTDKGFVEAVNYGTANITATCGEYSAVCVVTVQKYLESLAFTNAILWDVDTLYYGGKDTTLTLSSGETYRCYIAQATLWVMSDGFYINNSGHLDGSVQGTRIVLEAPMYYGTKALNPDKERGVSVVLGKWGVGNYPEGTIHGAHLGTLDDEAGYVSYMEAWAAAYNAAKTEAEQAAAYDNVDKAADLIGGTVMETLTYHSTSEGYASDGYYLPHVADALVNSGYFSLNNEGASDYMCGMDFNIFEVKPFLSDATHLWGIALNIDSETGISILDKKVHWDELIKYQYGEIPSEEAPKLEPVYAPVMKLDYPGIAAQVEAEMNNLVLRKQ